MVALDSIGDKIKALEKEISETKYNKRTQHAVGLLKAKLAGLKEKQETRAAKNSAVKDGYQVRRTGDATVILIGYPSTGKSTLLNSLTNADSEVGAYEFTTLSVIPGMMEYNSAKIQVLDVPGIVSGAASGRGRGKEVLACMRNADLCIVVIDAMQPQQLPSIMKELYDTGIRVNQKRPDVKLRKTSKDGIRIGKTVKLPELDDQTIKDVLKEMRINNADVLIRTPINVDQLIDFVAGNKKYMPMILIVNKMDALSEEKREEIRQLIKPDLMISAQKKIGLEDLKKKMFEKLEFIRVYLKEPGKPADTGVPLIIFKDSTVRNVCDKLHKDFVNNFKFCRVWGDSAKFGGQKLALTHVLKDKDILEVHIR